MEKITYEFTKERYEQFINEKKDTDIVVSLGEIFDLDNNCVSMSLYDINNYYIDITSFFVSYYADKPILIEKVLVALKKIPNIYIIINTNFSKKLNDLFPSLVNKIIQIDNIYQDQNECHRSFGELADEDLDILGKELEEKLFGHEDFKKDLMNKISDFQILNKMGEEKILSLFLCGKPGIGKTETARIIHKALYSYSKQIKINLGNYKTGGSLNSLIGSPKGYIGSERGGELTNKIKNSDSKVIIIDEFDKSDTDLYNFFYELLEDGKFTDLDENEYNLNGYMIIFTTNLDKDNYLEKIPAPIISRFTMLYNFSDISDQEKTRFVNYRINQLINNYNKTYSSDFKFENVIKKINLSNLLKLNDLRQMNRFVRKEFLDFVKNDVNRN